MNFELHALRVPISWLAHTAPLSRGRNHEKAPRERSRQSGLQCSQFPEQEDESEHEQPEEDKHNWHEEARDHSREKHGCAKGQRQAADHRLSRHQLLKLGRDSNRRGRRRFGFLRPRKKALDKRCPALNDIEHSNQDRNHSGQEAWRDRCDDSHRRKC